MRRIFILIVAFAFFFVAKGFASAQTGLITATVRAHPLKVQIEEPFSVTLGRWFDIPVNVTNLGSQTITNTSVSINNPSGLSIKGKKSADIGDLGSGETKNTFWEAKTNTPGDYIVIAEATGILLGETLTATDDIIISTNGSLGAFLRSLFFGPLGFAF